MGLAGILYRRVAKWLGDLGMERHDSKACPYLARGSGLPLTATLGALGVVYGDIGTSPLNALKEAAKAAAHGGPLMPDSILGVVSLILWALLLIISLKYARRMRPARTYIAITIYYMLCALLLVH